jgi:BirA family biotin operon repressor/biotin-[acetyl-CoA-carboxylase] ligase
MTPDAHGLVWLPECTSTNDLALGWLDRPEVRAVGADCQTGGRGRRGRSWHSPPGAGLYLTWIARPPFGPERGTVLPLLAAVAVAEVCAELGVRPMLLWPNDLLLSGRKLAGILCEARIGAGGWAAAVGMGLDLRTPPGGYPPDVPAVALDTVLADVPAPRDLALRLVARLEAWLARAAAEGAAPVIEAWQALGPPLGTPLRRGDLVGRYAGLGPDGALRLDTDQGEVQVHTGEVQLIDWRP